MRHRKQRRPGEAPRAPRSGGAGRRLAALVPALVALFVLAAACGGGADAGDEVATAGGKSAGKAPAGGKSEKDPQKAALEFARCMRQQGVDMPDPEVDDQGRMLFKAEGPAGGPREAARPIDEKAHQACRHLLDGVASGGDAKIDPAEQDRALKFARCMREHGVDMPDPDFSQGGVALEIGGDGKDLSSPTFKAAQEACKQFFGPPGGAGPMEPVTPGGSA